MSYFISIKTLGPVPGNPCGRKAINRMLYPTKAEARRECARLNMRQTGEFRVEDADREPGRTILRARGPG